MGGSQTQEGGAGIVQDSLNDVRGKEAVLLGNGFVGVKAVDGGSAENGVCGVDPGVGGTL